MDHCTPHPDPDPDPELERLMLTFRGLLELLLFGGGAAAIPRREGCFAGSPADPFPLLLVLLFGLLLFLRVGWGDRVEVEEEEVGKGRFILLAVLGAGGDACSYGWWLMVGGLFGGGVVR